MNTGSAYFLVDFPYHYDVWPWTPPASSPPPPPRPRLTYTPDDDAIERVCFVGRVFATAAAGLRLESIAIPWPAPAGGARPDLNGCSPGQGIAGATVRLTGDCGETWQTTSGYDGRFHFPSLPNGDYTLTVESAVAYEAGKPAPPQPTKPSYPDDRTSLWQRCRTWLVGGWSRRRGCLPIPFFLLFLIVLIWLLWPRPDLTIIAVAQAPDCGAHTTDVDVTVTNNGRRDAGPFVVRFGSETQSLAGLAAGATSHLAFAAPAAAAAPELVATVDATDVIRERNERNNRWSRLRAPLATTDDCAPEEKPDLLVAHLSVLEERACLGELLSATATAVVRNAGDVSAGPFVVALDGERRTVDGLAPGEEYELTWDVTGREVDLLVLDTDDDVVEADERNNHSDVVQRFIIRQSCPHPDPLMPDLSAELSVRQQTNCRGEVVQATATAVVRNAGAAPAGPIVVALDGERQTIDSLNAGEEVRLSWDVTEREVQLVVVDPDGDIVEADEANNSSPVVALTSSTMACLPDLTVTAVTVDQVAGCDGGLLASDVTVEVANVGEGDAGAFTVALDGQEQRLEGLAAGATATLSFTSAGSGDSVAIVDAADDIFETDETNNRRTVDAISLISNDAACRQPDLVIVAVTGLALPCGASDGDLDVTVLVHNSGDAPSGPFTVRANGASKRVAGLAPGASRTLTLRDVGGPAVTAVVDSRGQVAESNESNNIFQHTFTIQRTAAPCVPPPCLRFNFEVGRDALRGSHGAGRYEARTLDGALVASWLALDGQTDSDWIAGNHIPFESVHVVVTFHPLGGGDVVALEIVNHAPSVPYGWVARGQCHALEVQFPA